MAAIRLAELVRSRQPCVVLTGAGISTESGIPDFRSPTGIWASIDPMEYASLHAFREDPVKVWGFYAQRISLLRAAQPNAGHRALAELELAGLVSGVITQNIDLLHERAGSQRVIEVHGSIRTSSCPACGLAHALAEVLDSIERDRVPACRACAAILKPDVVFFGELLSTGAIDLATELARRAALMLVVGSALEVWPVAGLPLETIAAGGTLAIITRGPTALDDRAALRIEAGASETLTALVRELRDG